jgi:geranylgeranylglyceryl phosphate synthase family protein
MTRAWADWDHVLKIDPDKHLPEGQSFEDVCRTGTDAIEVGGTLDVTRDKMGRVIDACRRYDVPLYQEPSNPAVVVEHDSLAGYLVPVVMNAGDVSWVTGAHKEWVRIDSIDWNRTHTEAYIVMNPDASVAQLTGADCDQSADDVAAYAKVAERMFGQEIVYIEYSGRSATPRRSPPPPTCWTRPRCSTAAASTTTTLPTRWGATPTSSWSATSSTTRGSTRCERQSRARETPARRPSADAGPVRS